MSHRICKYHGRTCERPGYCLEWKPKKYDTDGHEETIDPERLTLGNVIRRRHILSQDKPNLPTFSDNVVIGIKVQYGTARRKTKDQEYAHFNTLAEAQADATTNDYIILVVARPYLYADNAFGSMPNYMLGAERYEILWSARDPLTGYKVVVQSTGEYACHMVRPLLHKWEVKVTGAGSEGWAPKDGKVFDDLSEGGARESYKIHRQMAQGAYGRKGGETVTLYCDGEIVEQYVGGM